MSKDLKAIGQRIAEFWNTGNPAIADEIYAPGFVNHAPYLPDVKDLESCKKCLTETRSGMPDFHITVEDMITEGDKLACRWIASGTHTADFFGIPATGKKVSWTGMTIYRFDSGKIVEAWWNEDISGLLKQLGITPTG